MIINIQGTYKINLLMDELLLAFPDWAAPNGCLLRVEGDSTSVRLTVPDNADMAKINTVLAAHNPNALSVAEQVDLQIKTAHIEFRSLPNWATWTPQQGADYVKAQVLAGQTVAEAQAWIDSNVTNIATAKTALKQLAAGLIALREIVSVMAKAILFLRDIAVRRQ